MESIKNRPKVSIIIPVYNTEHYLSSCLESVLSQSIEDIELLCIEDCSTDNSPAVLTIYSGKNERIKTFFNKNNKGSSAARNTALTAATGEYVAFIDSDDCLSNDCLKEMYCSAKTNDLDVLYFDFLRIDEEGKILDHEKKQKKDDSSAFSVMPGKELLAQRLAEENWSCLVQCQLWKLEFLHKWDLKFSEGFIHEDEAFSFKAAMLAERAMYLPMPWYHYRQRKNSIMTSSAAVNHYEGIVRAYLDTVAFIERFHLTEAVAFQYLKNMHYLLGLYRVPYSTIQESHSLWSSEDIYLLQKYFPITKKQLDELSVSAPVLPEKCLRVFLYGAGKVGRIMYQKLLDSGQMDKRLMGGFIVTKKTTDGDSYLGLPVCSIDEYIKHQEDCVIVSVGKTLRSEVVEQLKKRGVEYLG